jgi:hypothetical protein
MSATTVTLDDDPLFGFIVTLAFPDGCLDPRVADRQADRCRVTPPSPREKRQTTFMQRVRTFCQ